MSFSDFYKNKQKLEECRWWGKFKEDQTTILEVDLINKNGEKRKAKYKVCKVQEQDSDIEYILERMGRRYGLIRTTENKFHVVRFGKGKKQLIKPKGIFKEVDGKLIFEQNIEKQEPENVI